MDSRLSNEYYSLSQDIRYNLDIIAGTAEYPSIFNRRKLQPEDISEYTLEFLEIFANQISFLENNATQKSVTKQLNSYLAEVAGRVYNILESRQFNDMEVPLLANELISPSELAKTYNPCQVRDGLMALGDEYAILRVKGDGHCLFRSIGFGLLRLYEVIEDKESFLVNLQQLEKRFPELKNDIHNLITSLRSRKSASQLMGEQRSSDEMVQFLRHLACTYVKIHPKEFSSLILTEENSMEAYLNKMADMNTAKYGGHVELLALSKVLGVKFSIVDVSKQLLPSRIFTDVYEPEKEILSLGQHGIALLYRPGHYDHLFY